MNSPLTVADFIELLGGTFAAARLIDVTPKAVSNWKTAGLFPASRYPFLRDLFGNRGLPVPPEALFSFVPAVVSSPLDSGSLAGADAPVPSLPSS